MFELSFGLGASIVLIACIAEYADSTLGMGYGTSLTPVLLILGFEPLQVVPAVLLAELFTGLLAGIMHSVAGNADFSLRRLIAPPRQNINAGNGNYAGGNAGKFHPARFLRIEMSLHLKISLLIGFFSVIGSIIGANVAISVPTFYLKLYIGTLVVSMGVYILLTRNRKFKFSWPKLTSLAVLASFNKGISGGGYGPLVTGGQILAGVEGRSAVAITSLSEALTCTTGIIIYLFAGSSIDWTLAPYLMIGGLISVPLSAFSVRKIKTETMTLLIGFTATILGAYTLLNTLI